MKHKPGKVVTFHVHRTHPKVRRTVERDDLVQIGMIKAWQAVESYNGRVPLQAYLHEVLWRAFRDVVRDERRRDNVLEAAGSRDDLPEVTSPHRTDDDVLLKATVEEYRLVLSPLAFTVMHEYVFPGERTVAAARAKMLRKTHLKKRGVDVHGHDQVKLSPRVVAEGIGQPVARVHEALAEIKRILKGDE